ncbi:class I SAM-dependent methyltransferase [Virgibacillus flavescens]|uniref:class I SAM-dependent methyltransferase n=1 Tax=Virgibacillus flavescens TaxID=1611422 RepID=UPI003D33C47B
MSDSLTINKKSWNEAAHQFYGRNPLPEYGPLAPTEDEVNLLGDVTNQNVLDIGCGSGHSLKYMSDRNAGELYGLDLSSKQIEAAKLLLENSRKPAKLFESPMEVNPGIPENYFDVVYSIFALGWATDLDKTLENVSSYLKKDGIFIFSWEHPLHSRVSSDLSLAKSYHEEGPYEHEAWDTPAIMQQYKLSTYINALISHGLTIEKVIEDVRLTEDDVHRHANRWYSYKKAQSVPATMIIKCRKR